MTREFLKLALVLLPALFFIHGCSDAQSLPEKTYWFNDEGDTIAMMEKGKISFKSLNESKIPAMVFIMKPNGENRYQLSNPELKTTDFGSIEISPEVKMIKAQFGSGTKQKTLILHLAPNIEKDQLPTTTYFYENVDGIESSFINTYDHGEDSIFVDEQYVFHKNKKYKKYKGTYKISFTDGLIFDQKIDDNESNRYYLRSITDTSVSFISEEGHKWSENIVNEASHPVIPATFTERTQ